MNIILRAMVFGYSGFASQFRQIAYELSKRDDVNLRLEPWPEGSSGFSSGIDFSPYIGNEVSAENAVLLDCRLAHEWPGDQRNFLTRVGYSLLETDRIGVRWMKACNEMNLVLVPTKFGADVYRKRGVTTPIEILPLGFPPVPDGFNPRREWKGVDIPGHLRSRRIKTRILTTGNWSPLIGGSRKNFEGAIKAFTKQFGDRDDVVLLMKVYGNAGMPRDENLMVEKVKAELRADDLKTAGNICVVYGFYSDDLMRSFFDWCDYYLLPTHGEGIGLDLAYAAQHGALPIVTRWSGQACWVPEDVPYWIEPDGLEPVPPEMEVSSLGAIDYTHQWARVPVERIQDAMSRALGDSKESRRSKRAIFKETVEKMTVERSVDELLDSLRRLTEDSSLGFPIKLLKDAKEEKGAKRILIVQPQSLGDVLMLTGIIRGLVKKTGAAVYLMTKARNNFVVGFNEEGSELDDWFPGIEGVLPYPDPFYIPLYRDVINEQEICIKYGMDEVFTPYYATQVDVGEALSFERNGKTMVELYAGRCGLNLSEVEEPWLPEPSEEVLKVTSSQWYVIIHPSTFDDTKCWSHFPELVRRLSEKDVSAFQVGGKSDELIPGAKDFLGVGYSDFVALLENSKAFVGVDSFPAHVAGSIGKKTIVLYGSVRASYSKPYWAKWWKGLEVEDKPCGPVPCHQHNCKLGKKCIDSITVDKVWDELSEVL